MKKKAKAKGKAKGERGCREHKTKNGVLSS